MRCELVIRNGADRKAIGSWTSMQLWENPCGVTMKAKLSVMENLHGVSVCVCGGVCLGVCVWGGKREHNTFED